MTIDLFSPAGTKTKSLSLPESLFSGEINSGLAHQFLMLQQSNRRHPIAHAKTRGEVAGSTKKLFQQKHTGNARRGPIRSPVMRGGGKAFGPNKMQNYELRMPKSMRRAAIRSCLSMQAKQGSIIALEGFGNDHKTKILAALLKKLPLKSDRRVLIIWGAKNEALLRSARNLPSVETLSAAYLNPEDLLKATAIVFLEDAVTEADRIFGKKSTEKEIVAADEAAEPAAPKKKPAAKKAPAKKAAAKKTSSKTA
ncbi:MAG: 50S ribosomal protein L4 [Candidatus Peribacteraceae bacterium]|nr:50S ribosomal protein L4 [Candidatus Peribacteraceae bacterium]